MTGNRKLKVFYWTLAAIMGIFALSLFKGVALSGDQLIAIIGAVFANALVFTGGNVGEHFANKGTPPLPVIGEVKS